MSFSSFRRSFGTRLVPILVSIVIATAMWHTVSVRDRVESQYEVNVNFTGIPKNLIVTEGLINKVTIRISGPATLLQSLSGQHLSQQVDLSSIKKGVTIVPLAMDPLTGYYRAFELIDVQPPRLVVKADVAIERSVPVQPVITSPLRSGALTVEDVTVDPPLVSLWGPENVLSDITSLRLPITPDPKAAGTKVTQTMALDTPGLVSVTPSKVVVSYTITSRRTVVERRCRIHISSERADLYQIEPKDVQLSLEIPEALARSSSYLSGLKLDVLPPSDLDPGQSERVQIHYRVPDGMTIVSTRPETVLIRMRGDRDRQP